MVNSKKSSKSLIALVVMAILLVASIVLGATGAWFTSYKAMDPEDLTFGNIEITATADELAVVSSPDRQTAALMPGDEVTISFHVTNTGDKAFIAAKVTVEVAAADGATIPDAEITAFKSMFEGWYVNGELNSATFDGLTLTDNDIVAAGQTAPVDFTITDTLDGEKYGDEWELATVSVTIKVYAIQAENMAAANADDIIMAGNYANGSDTEEFEGMTPATPADPGEGEENN